jgi:hypothetical protein
MSFGWKQKGRVKNRNNHTSFQTAHLPLEFTISCLSPEEPTLTVYKCSCQLLNELGQSPVLAAVEDTKACDRCSCLPWCCLSMMRCRMRNKKLGIRMGGWNEAVLKTARSGTLKECSLKLWSTLWLLPGKAAEATEAKTKRYGIHKRKSSCLVVESLKTSWRSGIELIF